MSPKELVPCPLCKTALQRAGALARVGLPVVSDLHLGDAVAHAVYTAAYFGPGRAPDILCWCGLRPSIPRLAMNDGTHYHCHMDR